MDAYEDQYSRTGRKIRRVLRGAKWPAKRLLGLPRALLIELRWRLGDEIMALPVFESLRAGYPSDHVAVLTNFPELFENHPFVDAVNVIPPSVDRYVLLRGAPRQIHRLDHYCRVAGVPLPVSRPQLYYSDWSAPQLETLPRREGPIIAVATETTWPTKRWRRDRWRELCEELESRGARIVELGTGAESLGVGLSLLGQTSVREAACVLHHADLLVSCDSGLMHLALAANTPVAALFGATDPGILIRDEPNFYPICSALPCQGYWNRSVETPDVGRCPLNHACCLEDVSVGQVLSVIERRVTLREKTQ